MPQENVLLTGSTGFLGRYLSKGLDAAGYRQIRLGRKEGDVRCDLEREEPKLPADTLQLVVHAAGKAHVTPHNPEEQAQMVRAHADAASNLLKSLERSQAHPKAFVFISSVAVYGREEGEGITEDEPLLGKTPYAEGKRLAEQNILEWCASHDVKAAILRLPLVVGRDAPGNLGSLTRAIERGRYFRIGDGAARRSMVLAEDVATILPRAADEGGVYNLTDGCHPSIRDLDMAIARHVGRKRIRSIPMMMARVAAAIGDGAQALTGRKCPLDTPSLRKLTRQLTFADQRARDRLAWRPRPAISYYE